MSRIYVYSSTIVERKEACGKQQTGRLCRDACEAAGLGPCPAPDSRRGRAADGHALPSRSASRPAGSTWHGGDI